MSHDIAPIPALYDPDLEDQPRLVDDQGWMDFSASLDLPQHQPTFALSSYSAQPSMTDHRHARQKQRHDNHYQFLLEHLPRTSSTTSPYFNAGSMSRAIPTFYNPDLEAQPELQGHQGWAQQSWKDFVASLDLPQRHPVVASSSPHFNSGPVHDLQNYLQGYLAGNLMPCFSWSLSQSGPDHLKIHHATALCESSPSRAGFPSKLL
ncbi:hypothetical protein F5148DRAFT_1193631 [Russula earlei]|uniref:Uncharacterized protein n=1 Tax=Russula earlei TaxID=71964 RepID=A0ACC0UC76_9AGAM|nr:hypothetical protein F5148DRAFT_1193631 [Russula earlei]